MRTNLKSLVIFDFLDYALTGVIQKPIIRPDLSLTSGRNQLAPTHWDAVIDTR